MEKVNLLSVAEMKNIIGGNETLGRCLTYQDFASCSFEYTPGVIAGGECGYSDNGKQCRCIAGFASVPWNACLTGHIDDTGG